jgi:hypothetical protein
MGEVINGNKMSVHKYKGKPYPVVLCAPKAVDERAIENAGYVKSSLNLELAKVLAAAPAESRINQVREAVLSVLPRKSSLYLIDYEMLFDPRYGIDVIKLFCEIARRQSLLTRWCGEIHKQTLVYAEPGYPEHKQYRIADYDVICVI